MRRKEREITNFNDIVQIIQTAGRCRLGLYDGQEVYIVPLNYGYEINEQTFTLYFHSAKKGRKIDILKENPKVGFEIDLFYGTLTQDCACNSKASYQSIIGNGTISFIQSDEEKMHALQLIMNHYAGVKEWKWSSAMVNSVEVFKLELDKYTAKEANRR